MIVEKCDCARKRVKARVALSFRGHTLGSLAVAEPRLSAANFQASSPPTRHYMSPRRPPGCLGSQTIT